MSSRIRPSHDAEVRADALHAEAARLVGQRQPAAAATLLRSALALDPEHVPSLHLLGWTEGRLGHDQACVELLERAVRLGTPAQAGAAGELLAWAHRRAGRPDAAEAAYRAVLRSPAATATALAAWAALLRERGRPAEAIAAIAAHPGLGRHPGPRYELGLAFMDSGSAAEAADALTEVVAADPTFAPARAALSAALLEAGDLAGAEAAALAAAALSPDDPAVARSLAAVRTAQGRQGEAAAICRTALARGDDAGLLNTLGIALKAGDDLAGAASAFERALARRPGHRDALFNLAGVRRDGGDADQAIALYDRVIAQAPDLAAARIARCMAWLTPSYRDEAAIEKHRRGYTDALEGLAAFADAAGPASLADGIGAAQPFYLAAQGRVDAALQRRYGALVCAASEARFAPVPLADPPRPGERLRLGVVCGFLRDHSVWRLPTRGWIEGLDRARFSLTAYHTSAARDAETDRLAPLFDRFHQGPFGLTEWRRRIAADRPHALLYPEIGIDPMAARLAALRLAPDQYASWGHPSTTGYPTIDLFLSAALMEPAGAEAHYTERLARLPGLSTPIAVEGWAGETPSRAAVGLPADAPVFWCGQPLHKYLPRHDALLAEIAARVPTGVFVFVAYAAARTLLARFRARLARAFRARGLSADRHLLFVPEVPAPLHRARLGCADVVLDSVGWSGCNSLLDAVVHGLPIVTWPGETMRSRHGAALLTALGADELICDSAASYVDRAAGLARSPGERARIGAKLRGGAGRLADRSAVTALEALLWSTACGDDELT